MNWPFVTFAASWIIILGTLYLAARSQLGQNLINYAADHAKTYASAYVQCLLLASVNAYLAFKAEFQPITADQALHFSWWDWAIHLLAPPAAFGTTVIAFLNSSIQKAQTGRTPTTPPFPQNPAP